VGDFTDPELLDEPERIIAGASHNVRLDDPEVLLRESVRESFSWWRPKSLPRFNGPAINDLVVHRWHGPLLTASAEIDIVRRVQARERLAFDKLLAGFHRQLLKIADGHMPRYWRPRRQSLRDKHTHTLFYEDLVAAAEGIKQFRAWGGNPEFDYPTTDTDEAVEIAGGGSFVSMYSCFSWYTLSPQLKYHEPLSLLVDRLCGGLDTGSDVGEVRRPKAPEDLDDYNESAVVQFKNGKGQVTRQKAASYCYGIVVSPELRARATENLEFAKRRWERRIWRGPLPAQTYARWSIKFGLGRLEHENRQIVPAYVPVTRFKWEVEYRGAEGNVLSILESPSRHCLKSRPCAICSRSRANNVPRLSVSLSAA
jgi:hypothetical protein